MMGEGGFSGNTGIVRMIKEKSEKGKETARK